MKNTIAILGSARRHGNTGQLMDHITDELNIEVIDLAQLTISPYDYQHRNLEDDFLSTVKHILSHENIIFASPIYWYSMSAQMKIFFDRVSSLLSIEELKTLGRAFRTKKAFIVTTSVHKEADNTFIDTFTKTFDYLGISYGGYIHACCKELFDASQHQTEISNFTHLIKASE